MKLCLITTGGTIDGAEGHDVRDKSLLCEYLSTKMANDVDCVPLMNKDSRHITLLDRQNLVNCINRTKENYILVGHGSYTICETGRFLKAHLHGTGKTIVLVCSRKPIDASNTDGPQQVDEAIDAMKTSGPGIYVAMDGRLWNPDLTGKIQNTDGTWWLAETTAS